MNLDISKLLQQAREMQQDIKTSHDELTKQYIEAEAGAGMVKIKANAVPQIINIQIEDSLMTDKEMLEDLVKAAVNSIFEKAKLKSDEIFRNKTGEIMSKLNLHDLGNDTK